MVKVKKQLVLLLVVVLCGFSVTGCGSVDISQIASEVSDLNQGEVDSKIHHYENDMVGYELPIYCDGENVLFSDDGVVIRNIKYLSAEPIIEDNGEVTQVRLKYSGEIEIIDDFYYSFICLTFGVSNKKDALILSRYGDDACVMLSDLKKGSIQEFELDVDVSKDQLDKGNLVGIVFVGFEYM